MQIAITGAGALGSQHAHSAGQWGARIAVVHDSRLEAAQKLAAVYGARATDKLSEVFSDPIDGLIVATPPPVRIEPVTLACRHGAHLFVEKPPAYDLAEGRACLREIEKAGVIAAVGFNLRYDPRYSQLRQIIGEREVHLVRTVCTINYYLDYPMAPWFLQKPVSGGPIAEQAIHLLDCVRFLFDNAEATRALARGAKNMASERTEFDAENALHMLYELDNGVFATHMNHCGHERFCFDLEVVGPHLRLHANITEGEIHGVVDGQEVRVAVEPAAPGSGRLEAWLGAISCGDAALVRSPYGEALHTQALVDAAIRSQSTMQYEEVEKI